MRRPCVVYKYGGSRLLAVFPTTPGGYPHLPWGYSHDLGWHNVQPSVLELMVNVGIPLDLNEVSLSFLDSLASRFPDVRLTMEIPRDALQRREAAFAYDLHRHASDRAPVLFRKFDGEIVALLPRVRSDSTSPTFCQSYSLIGEHSSADPWLVMQNSRPATLAEFDATYQALHNRGYALRTYQKMLSEFYNHRCRQAFADPPPPNDAAVPTEADVGTVQPVEAEPPVVVDRRRLVLLSGFDFDDESRAETPVQAGNRPAKRPERERCEGCELSGLHYYSGIPGIRAWIAGGFIEDGGTVERCDTCQRYGSDLEALQKLIELGMAE